MLVIKQHKDLITFESIVEYAALKMILRELVGRIEVIAGLILLGSFLGYKFFKWLKKKKIKRN